MFDGDKYACVGSPSMAPERNQDDAGTSREPEQREDGQTMDEEESREEWPKETQSSTRVSCTSHVCG